MASLLYRLGKFAAARRWAVLIVWLVVLAVVGGGALAFKGVMSDSFKIPNTPAQTAINELSERIPGAGGHRPNCVRRPRRAVLDPACLRCRHR